ncbi:hypothetical protein AMJ86_04990 [bacterium SM23_57]|nr:MAG: hypothetical protein AMJ86_04990 [bacterium SM23_57]
MNPSPHEPAQRTLSSTDAQTAKAFSELKRQVDGLTELLIRLAPATVIGELTPIVAHEINNPVFGVLNFLELSIEELDRSHPVQEYLNEALTQTERISYLIGEIQCLYKAPASSPESFDPSNAIRSAIVLYQKWFMRSGIDVKQEFAKQTSMVFGVRGQLIGAIIDLFDNARKAMEAEERGIVEIRCCVTDSAWFRIEIEDHGIGLPDRDVSELFLPLISTWDPPGAGLGLYRVKHCTDKMKGNIALEACSTHPGTRAVIELPPHTDGNIKVTES